MKNEKQQCKTKISESDQLKTVLAIYEQEINQNLSQSKLSVVADRGEQVQQIK